MPAPVKAPRFGVGCAAALTGGEHGSNLVRSGRRASRVQDRRPAARRTKDSSAGGTSSPAGDSTGLSRRVPMLLDITVQLHEAERLLLAPAGVNRARCVQAHDELLRSARNPRVMGDQRGKAIKLAEKLAEHLGP